MLAKLKDWISGSSGHSVDVRTLKEVIEEGHCPLIIDVRTAFEFRTGRIPCAVHVPLNQVTSQVPDLAEGREGKVFLICQSGNRSAGAQQSLNSLGVETVNVTGGMRAWDAAGFRIE